MKRAFYFLIILFIFFEKNISAQWKQTNGPYGGFVECILINGSDVYIGTSFSGGVYRSIDGGGTWAAASSHIVTSPVICMTALGENLLIGTQRGLFLAQEHGKDWKIVPDNYLEKAWIRSLAVMGQYVFAGTIGGGIYRSENSGSTWAAMNSGIQSYGNQIDVLSIASIDTFIYLGTNTGIYKSNNNGESWIEVSKLTNVLSFTLLGSDIFVAGRSIGIYKSSKFKDNWTEIKTEIKAITSLISKNSMIYASTDYSGIFRSDNAGISWKACNLGLSSRKVHSLAATESRLYAGTYGVGISTSLNNGDRWTTTNIGLINTEINCIAVKGTQLFAGTEFAGLFRSDDYGASWLAKNGGLESDATIFCLAVNNEGNLLASFGGVYISYDSADTWISTGVSAEDIGIIGRYVFTGSDFGYMRRSSDNGLTWKSDSRLVDVTAFTTSDSLIFAATYYDGIMFSADSGATWEYFGMYNAPIKTLAAIDSFILAGTNNGGLSRRTLKNKRWESANTGFRVYFGSYIYIGALAVIGHNLFAANEGDVYISSDKGSHWEDVSTGLPGHYIFSIAACGEYLYVGLRGKGIWCRPLSEIVSDVDSHLYDIPASYLLEQNYPNPFNLTTNIMFSLPNKSYTSLKIYDLTGKEVAVLVSEELSAGKYSRQWNVAHQASGVYFYRLQTENYSETKKLTMLK